uniref:DUF4421 domain-containing protein n=1 Tax=Segatella oulorum TaxID=28136 RepID=UPI0023EFCDB6
MGQRKLLFSIVLLLLSLESWAGDTLTTHQNLWEKLYTVVKRFSQIDTAYIEPQRYNYALMLQNTNTYEMYRISNRLHQTVQLSPRMGWRVGPYFGWRWIFLGYTIDVTHLKGDNKRKEFDLSLYSNQLGIDLFYRTTGDDYHIQRFTAATASNIDFTPLHGLNYDGLEANIRGFNLYYITNHKKFSYPAAFSQSTRQIRSTGSPILGVGYTHHRLSMDWKTLRDVVTAHLGHKPEFEDLAMNSFAGTVKYDNYAVMGGYGYNWVFARDWLFGASLSASLAYLHTISEEEKQQGASANIFRINK